MTMDSTTPTPKLIQEYKELSAQEAFDSVALWLLRKDATQCKNPETGNCVYGMYEMKDHETYGSGQRLEFINACGIGGIIDDPLRQRIVFGDYVEHSGKGVRDLIDNVPELHGWTSQRHLLSTLQQVHDTDQHWTKGRFNALGIITLAEIARDNGLSTMPVRRALEFRNQ